MEATVTDAYEGVVAAETTFSLSPATQYLIPDRMSLGTVRTWRGFEGNGFEAVLKVDDKVVGTLVDEGTGGDIFLNATSREASDLVDSLVLAWDQERTKRGLVGTHHPSFIQHEILFGNLVEEHHTAKKLNRQAKTQICVIKGSVRTVSEDAAEYNDQELWSDVVWATAKTAPSNLDKLRPRLIHDGFTHYWNGQKWTELS